MRLAPCQSITHMAPLLRLCVVVAVCMQPPSARAVRDQQPSSRAGDTGWGTGDNVLAAIDHYGQRIQQRNASAEDFKHLSTALRFAGVLAFMHACVHLCM